MEAQGEHQELLRKIRKSYWINSRVPYAIFRRYYMLFDILQGTK